MKFFVRLQFVFGAISENVKKQSRIYYLKKFALQKNLHYIYKYEKNSICFCLQKRHLPTKSVF